MSWWTRLRRVIASELNYLIGKAEDPEKMLDEIVIELQQQIAKAKQQVAAAMADEIALKRRMDKEKDLAKEWEEKAKKALESGKEDLAKEALQESSRHEELAKEYEKQWEAQREAVAKLRQELGDLNIKVQEAKRKKDILIARAKRAKAQKSIQEALSGISESDAMSAFERMEKKVDQLESEAEVSKTLLEQTSGSDLEDKFKRLEETEKQQSLDQRLLSMKKELGLIPRSAEKNKQ